MMGSLSAEPINVHQAFRLCATGGKYQQCGKQWGREEAGCEHADFCVLVVALSVNVRG
ncbi:MAG: hypothetical protein GXP17_00115 [Gammaproteobacteria bacterium]|nr:hypothetical protein [Gammaproteobacteria bacterium]